MRALMRRPAELSDVTWPYGTFLQRLGPPVRVALLELGVRRRVPPGQIVIHEGVRESHLVLLEEGLTKVTATLPDGRAALLALRVGGDLVGEMSALNDRPRSASVTTCGPATYRVIQPDRFKAFLKEHPDAALELAAMVSDRLRWSNRRRIDFTSYPVKIGSPGRRRTLPHPQPPGSRRRGHRRAAHPARARQHLRRRRDLHPEGPA